MKCYTSGVLLALCLCLAGPGQAEEMTTLSPQHKTASELAPVLQAAFPQAGVSAFYQQLIVRAPDAATLAQIEAMLARLDTPVRQITLTVEQRQLANTQGWQWDADGRLVISDGKAGGSLALRMAQLHRDSRLLNRSMASTLEGGQVWIQLGQSRFYPVWQAWPSQGLLVRGGQWVSTGTGFYARPQIQGEGVRVLLSPQASRFQRDGSIAQAGVEAEVLALPGQWQLIGESRQDGSSQQAGLSESGQQSGSQSYQVWLRVDIR